MDALRNLYRLEAWAVALMIELGLEHPLDQDEADVLVQQLCLVVLDQVNLILEAVCNI